MPYLDGGAPPLTDEQKDFWLEHGYIKIPRCFSREQSDAFSSTVWDRLGADPNDRSTWPTDKLNMPGHSVVSCKEFAPKAWAAICELVGGEEKVADWCKDWKDGWIVNPGREAPATSWPATLTPPSIGTQASLNITLTTS